MNAMTLPRFFGRPARCNSFRRNRNNLIDMLAFSGHELNNVLSRVLLNIEQMTREPDTALSERQTQALSNLSQNARLLRSIAQSYITLARLEGEAMIPNQTPLDIVTQILEPLVDGYAEILREQRQTCQIRASAVGLSLCADPALMTSVFDNLLNNAIKHGEHGSPILITTAQAGADLEVCFANRAPNLNPEAIPHLFERFTRGSNAGSRDGFGIGLYLVKRVVETHGGSVRVEATPHGEVKFTVRLPACIA